MGLDAMVYCDCFERGSLRIPPPDPQLLAVGLDGAPSPTLPEDLDAYFAWEAMRPCPHDRFVLLHHRLGNMGTVGWMRSSLKRIASDPEEEFPVFWGKVIYSGIHSGDWLGPPKVDALRVELDRLLPAPLSWPEDDRFFFSEFVTKLQGLVYAALWVNKPIVF